MILSFKHKFIFIKTTKTAGTSIEIMLSRFCGQDDVITPIHPTDERLRKELGYRGPQNYQFADRREAYNHMPLSEVRELFGSQVIDDFFKFCVTRHPAERAVSLYYFDRKGQRSGKDLESYFLSGRLRKIKERGWGLYTEDGEITVDRVIRYENLKLELAEVMRHIGLPSDETLPRAKGGYRADRRPYSELMSPDLLDRIREMFREECEYFGYEI